MAMEMVISFPGGARVDAEYGGMVIRTDQPPSGGGEGSAPTPFALFLASMGTCAGIYVLSFCQQRGVPTDNLRIRQSMEMDPNKRAIYTDMKIFDADGYPKKSRKNRTMRGCEVSWDISMLPFRVGSI